MFAITNSSKLQFVRLGRPLPVAMIPMLCVGGLLAFAWPSAFSPVAPVQPSPLAITFAVDEPNQAPHVPDEKVPDKISFNAHIRPIMSDTCFTCHGPDEEANESGLRMDSFEAAVEEGEAIEPGNSADSLVYERLIDADDPMPPAEFRHQLSDYDKALFRRWIDQGAKYESHWSYTPLQRPAVPAVAQPDKIANEIDAFVQARLELEGFELSPSADKATLLRRLSLDLIGLPPTPMEVESFLADNSPDAYDKQVERLLASPHYGERMASQWLDIVRFSDTVGFHGDQNQNVFAYRDYVVDSLNNNKPFDQFTREQLAGDLLDSPTDQQLIATCLIRLNMMTREGGAQPEEYLAKYTGDRVRMLGTAFMGATTGCCECHNHKYDPLTTKDFYSLGAFFDDIRQWGVYSDYGYTPNPDLKGFNNDYPFPPELRSPSRSLASQIRFLETAVAKTIVEKLDETVYESSEFGQWVNSLATVLDKHNDGWIPLEIAAANSSKETPLKQLDDGSLLVSGESKSGDSLTAVAATAYPLNVRAIRLEAMPDESHDGFIGRGQNGRFGTSFSAKIKRYPPESETSSDKSKQAVRPRFVRIELDQSVHLSLAEVEVFVTRDSGKQENIALKGTATQSSTSHDGDATLAIDGNTDGNYRVSNSVTHTGGQGNQQWWELDLGSEQELSNIVVWNRTDNQYGPRLKGYRVVLLNKDRKPVVRLSPDYPDPSTKIPVPTEPTVDFGFRSVKFAYAQADRDRPAKFTSGRPSLFLADIWQSGPSRWQLPSDEAKLKHTAVYHLQSALNVDPRDRLNFILNSDDIGRFRISVSPLTRFVAGMPAADQSLIDAVKSHQTGSPVSEDQRQSLLAAYYLATTPVNKLPADIKLYRDNIVLCRSGMAMTTVAQQTDAEKMRHSRVLPRGNWQDKTGEEVAPATPGFLPQLPESKTRRLSRLDLANWITSPDNPLTARHYVNRTWKHFFGAGLSNRLDDLGNQGEWPSHPLLLDWLSDEFRQSWDMKHIARMIVTSNTYQQKVSLRSQVTEIDPYNRLLSQQSPRRLEAETIRDNALAIAGLLTDDFVGGPSVYPYQPDGHYSNLQFPNRGYSASPHELQYRRGVYMHWQRTFLHPMLVNFDAPSRDECVADRTRSNSPQQALTLLNDPQFVEASIAFAADLIGDESLKDFDSRLNAAFKRAVARGPVKIERDGLLGLYERQKEYYAKNEPEIKELLDKNGSFRPDDSLDQVELAAWSQVCRVILNLHETITRF